MAFIHLRRRMSPQLIAAAIAVILIGVTARLGGFREVPATPYRMLEVGQAIDVGPWRIRPLRAWIGSMCPMDSFAGEPKTCLSVEADVLNLTNKSNNTIANAIRLIDPAAPADRFPTLELVRDRYVLGFLHPKLPERIVVSWKLPPQPSPPSRVTIALWSTRFKERDNLVGGEGWFDPKEAARVQIPLTEPDPAAMRVQNRL